LYSARSKEEWAKLDLQHGLLQKKDEEHKARIALAVSSCKSFNPLVGVKFTEHPGDGIKIKVIMFRMF